MLEELKLFIGSNPILIWQISKVTGISAFIFFTLVVCMGLTMTSKLSLKLNFIYTATILSLHSFTATFIGLTLVLLHVASIILSPVVGLQTKDALIPFHGENDFRIMGYQSYAVTSGIIALYISILLITTARLRKRLPHWFWRSIHYLSFLFYTLMVYHAVTAGSLTKNPLMQMMYFSSLTLVVSLILVRIFGKKYFLPRPVRRVQEQV